MLRRSRALLADGGSALPAWPLLGVVCAAAATMVVVLGTRLSFYNDDWFFVYQRPGWGLHALLDPHNGHLSLLPVLVYKGLISAFGLDSQLPFRLVLAGVLVTLGALVFVFVRQRAGTLLALVATAVLLFLGPAYEDLLWTFEIGLIGSLASGVGVLLAIERGSRRADVVACVLLVVSILFSNLGVCFIVAAGVAVLVQRRPRQLWVAAIPALLFGVWALSYGRTETYAAGAGTDFSLGSIARTPVFVLDAISAGLVSLTGISRSASGATFEWGPSLLALAAVAVVVWVMRGGRPSRFFYPVAAAGLSFWILSGASQRLPFESRYQLISATFLVLAAAELFRPVRLRPEWLAALTAAGAIAIVANADAMREGYDRLHGEARLAKADLGALAIAAPHSPAVFQLIEPVAHTPYISGVTAGAYLRETAAHGSPPAASPQELAVAPPDLQAAADNVLAAGYELRFEPAAAPPAGRRAGCRRVDTGAAGADVPFAPGEVTVVNQGPADTQLGVHRFAPADAAIALGSLPPGSAGRFALASDRVDRRWRLTAAPGTSVLICVRAEAG